MNISLNYLVTYLENYLVNIDLNYLENSLKGFMIAEGGGAQGDAPEQADDGSNTEIYLNMSGDGIEAPSIQDDAAAEQDDAAGEQSANVHIITIFTCIEHHIFI